MPAYSAILRRNPSTSSKMFTEKNFGNSVDDVVRDNGGICCKAFLGGKQHKETSHSRNKVLPQNQTDNFWNLLNFNFIIIMATNTAAPAVHSNVKNHKDCVLLCALQDLLSQSRVRLHGSGDQRGEERQVPDGWSIRNRHLFTLGNLIAQCLQTMNPCVTAVAQASLNVYLNIWDSWGDNVVSSVMEYTKDGP